MSHAADSAIPIRVRGLTKSFPGVCALRGLISTSWRERSTDWWARTVDRKNEVGELDQNSIAAY